MNVLSSLHLDFFPFYPPKTMLACPVVDAFPKRPSHTPKRKFSSHEGLLLLQKCTHFKHLKQIHARFIRNNLAHDPTLVTKLLRLCASYNKIDYATLVFNQIPNPRTFTWNIMIRAHTHTHTHNGAPRDAILLYNLMLQRHVRPDKFTFPFIIKACSLCYAIEKGKEVHGYAVKMGFGWDFYMQNTLMDMYFKCGDLECGRNVFDKMRVRNVVSWTTLVSGLVACGDLEGAREVFENMSVKNVVSWTAMINGYAKNGRPYEGFQLFRRMQEEQVRPNEFTLVSLLVACTELGSLSLGSWVHDFALKNGFELSVHLGTTLIDMYSKCGSLEDAIKVFDKMPRRNLATWNAMITSLGVHGHSREAIELFREMEKANLRPDEITFIGVLCACVHEFMVYEAYGYFKYMTKHYGIVPMVEHYGCMVEILGRAGMLDEAYELVKNMDVEPDVYVWRALLKACKMHGDVELEGVAYKQIGEIEALKGSIMVGDLAQRKCHLFEWEVG